MLYRQLMQYPPAANILLLLVSSKDEEKVDKAIVYAGEVLKEYSNQNQHSLK